MKKLSLVLAAALLALTACAAPTATPKPASFPVGTLTALDVNSPTPFDVYTRQFDENWTVISVDPDTAQEQAVLTIPTDDSDMQSGWFRTADGVMHNFRTDAEGTRFRCKSVYPDGHSVEPIAAREITPQVVDEHAAYDFTTTPCARLDFETGEVTTFTAPFSQLSHVHGIVDNQVLLSLILTDSPLPTAGGNSNGKYDALLETARLQYALYDIASNTATPLFDDPYYNEVDTTWKRYEGYCGDMLYFSLLQTTENGFRYILLGFDRASGTWQEVYVKDSVQSSGRTALLGLDGQLQCLLVGDTEDTLTFYKTADGQTYDVPFRDAFNWGVYGDGENYGWPMGMVGDGLVVVTDGYIDPDTSPADAYGLIALDDYLAGSTDYTPVQMWEP